MSTKVLILLFKICLPLVCVASQRCGSLCSDGCDVLTRVCYNCTGNTYDRFCDTPCSRLCRSSCDRYSGNCDSCNTGRYASWCIELCSAGCRSGCDMETGNCGLCKTGWYGVWCNEACPTNCNGACNKITGNCLKCNVGYYGRHCNVACTDNDCPGGCDQFYGTCNKCLPGFYGRQCNIACIGNCKDSLCDSFSGHCFDCEQGYFGLNCSQTCPHNCNGICNFQTGLCFSCKVGYYGENCSSQCPDNCLGPCRQSGTCFSCLNIYFGDRCQYTCPPYCLTSCDQLDGKCFNCEDGHWGDSCNKTCGHNCVGPCYKDSGRCTGCKPGWYGLNCQEHCPVTCENNSCTAVGICPSCVNGFYGDMCQNECAYCINNTCTQQDGVCTAGCKNRSECEDTFSSTSKPTDLTTSVTITAGTMTSTMATTKETTNDRTTATRTTTEVSIQPENDDNSMLIIIIVAVLVLLSLISVVIVYCIRKRRAASKSASQEQTHNEYCNIYDEINEVDVDADNTTARSPSMNSQNNVTDVHTGTGDDENARDPYDELQNVIEDTQYGGSRVYPPVEATINGVNDQTSRKNPYNRSLHNISNANGEVSLPRSILKTTLNDSKILKNVAVRNNHVLGRDNNVSTLSTASDTSLSSGYEQALASGVNIDHLRSDCNGVGNQEVLTVRTVRNRHVLAPGNESSPLSVAFGTTTISSGYEQPVSASRLNMDNVRGDPNVEDQEILTIRNRHVLCRDNDTSTLSTASGTTLSSGYEQVSESRHNNDDVRSDRNVVEDQEVLKIRNRHVLCRDNDTNTLSTASGTTLSSGYEQVSESRLNIDDVRSDRNVVEDQEVLKIRNRHVLCRDNDTNTLSTASGTTLSSGYEQVSESRLNIDDVRSDRNVVEDQEVLKIRNRHVLCRDNDTNTLSTASGTTLSSGYEQVSEARLNIDDVRSDRNVVEDQEVLTIRNRHVLCRDNDTNTLSTASGTTLSSGYEQVSESRLNIDDVRSDRNVVEDQEVLTVRNRHVLCRDNDTSTLSTASGTTLSSGYEQVSESRLNIDDVRSGSNAVDLSKEQRDRNRNVLDLEIDTNRFSVASRSTLSSGYNQVTSPRADFARNYTQGKENAHEQTYAACPENCTGSISGPSGCTLTNRSGEEDINKTTNDDNCNTYVQSERRSTDYCVVFSKDYSVKVFPHVTKKVLDESATGNTENDETQSLTSDYAMVT